MTESELDDRVKAVQAAYEKAIKDGDIDPNRIDIERFADIIADDTEYFTQPSKDMRQEVQDSRQAVAHLFSGKDSLRNKIIKKWFGREE